MDGDVAIMYVVLLWTFNAMFSIVLYFHGAGNL